MGARAEDIGPSAQTTVRLGWYGVCPSPAPPGGPRHGRRPPSQLGGHRRSPTSAGPCHVACRGVLGGGLRQVADRRGVVLERGDAVQLPPGQACGARERGRSAGRRRPDRVHHDRGLRRYRDGPRGHEGFPDQPRGDRRLGGARDACRAVRRPGGDRRLRQERAGDVDGDGAAEPDVGLPVRRHDPGGHVSGPRHHDPRRLRGRRRPRERHHERRRVAAGRARRMPHHRVVRGHVHGEHHGRGGRGDGHVAPGCGLAPSRRLPPGGVRARIGAPGRMVARERRPAPPRHHHEGSARERDRGRDGGRRFDERRAAPARDRARGARAARARRLRRDLATRSASGRRPARGEVRDAGPGSRRRRPRRDEGAARRGAPARRLRSR